MTSDKRRVRLWAVAGAAVLALFTYAWIDGGREGVHEIVMQITVPEGLR